ncbi:MAG: hypothetical protein WCV72_04695 [Patescibacteria group bacterium]
MSSEEKSYFVNHSSKKTSAVACDCDQPFFNYLAKNGWEEVTKEDYETRFVEDGWTFIPEHKLRAEAMPKPAEPKPAEPGNIRPAVFYFQKVEEPNKYITVEDATEASNYRNNRHWKEVSEAEFLEFETILAENAREPIDWGETRSWLGVLGAIGALVALILIIVIGLRSSPDLTAIKSDIEAAKTDAATAKTDAAAAKTTSAAAQTAVGDLKTATANAEKKLNDERDRIEQRIDQSATEQTRLNQRLDYAAIERGKLADRLQKNEVGIKKVAAEQKKTADELKAVAKGVADNSENIAATDARVDEVESELANQRAALLEVAERTKKFANSAKVIDSRWPFTKAHLESDKGVFDAPVFPE